MVVRSFLCLRRRAKISGYNDISALRRESIFGWAASSKQAVADLRRSADEERSGSPILRAPRDERCSKSDRGGRPHLFREEFRVAERFILPKSGRSGYYRFCNYGNYERILFSLFPRRSHQLRRSSRHWIAPIRPTVTRLRA